MESVHNEVGPDGLGCRAFLSSTPCHLLKTYDKEDFILFFYLLRNIFGEILFGLFIIIQINVEYELLHPSFCLCPSKNFLSIGREYPANDFREIIDNFKDLS